MWRLRRKFDGRFGFWVTKIENGWENHLISKTRVGSVLPLLTSHFAHPHHTQTSWHDGNGFKILVPELLNLPHVQLLSKTVWNTKMISVLTYCSTSKYTAGEVKQEIKWEKLKKIKKKWGTSREFSCFTILIWENRKSILVFHTVFDNSWMSVSVCVWNTDTPHYHPNPGTTWRQVCIIITLLLGWSGLSLQGQSFPE